MAEKNSNIVIFKAKNVLIYRYVSYINKTGGGCR